MPLVKCPKCGKPAEYAGNIYRPFCSERCKLIDFGAWVDEEYSIPVENGGSEAVFGKIEEWEQESGTASAISEEDALNGDRL